MLKEVTTANRRLVVDKEVVANLMAIVEITPEKGKYPYWDRVRECVRQQTCDWWDIVRARAYQ